MKSFCNEGIVREVHEDHYMIEVILQSACAACHAKSMCMPSQRKGELMKAFGAGEDRFSVGETVTIYMEKHLGTRAVIISYLIPFIILIVSLFIIYFWTKNELLSSLLSLLFMILYYFLLWILDKGGVFRKKYVLYIKKKI